MAKFTLIWEVMDRGPIVWLSLLSTSIILYMQKNNFKFKLLDLNHEHRDSGQQEQCRNFTTDWEA